MAELTGILDLPDGVDTVVRVHDTARLVELDRALFSLACQSFSPVRPIIVMQNFSIADQNAVRQLADRFAWQEHGHKPPITLNVDVPQGQDARAKLLNAGAGVARHRFLAFLDFDDYLYGDAYQYLASQAATSNSAVTFGGIMCRNVRVFEQFVYTLGGKTNPYPGADLGDLLTQNFCPLHSFILDRAQIVPEDITFNIGLRRLEDYEFLLRICTKYSSCFSSRSKLVGVYNWHLDGRGTTQVFGASGEAAQEDRRAWAEASRHVWKVKAALRTQLSDHAVPTPPDRREPPMLFPPGHFYSPITDPDDMRAKESSLWSGSDDLPDIDLGIQAQLALLRDLEPHAASAIYPEADPGDGITYFYGNDQYPALDATFLHAALRYFRPRSMIEVGSGYSSLVTADVNRRFLSGNLDFVCIEPYPRQFLINGVSGISGLITSKVEDVDISFFGRLRADDILFIDSSHVVKTGSDVTHLLFKVLPGLQPGVLVHIHDIFLPDEYPKRWVIEEGRNWNEQYFVRAFLSFNPDFEIVWAAHYMGTRHPEAIRRAFPHCVSPSDGGSLWIRRIVR